MNGVAVGATEITIGLPVFNGERHLRAAMDSLLAQSFRDFTLLISDNGSTDRTRSICEAYARMDARVRYIRHEQNRGAVFNWNFVAEGVTSPFFKWAASNDFCPPTMLEHCLDELRSRPDVVLCYGNTAEIDNQGTLIGEQHDDPEILDASASTRFVRVLNELICNNAQSGLIRTSALRKTRLERDYLDGDMVLMAELALLGGFRKLDEIFLYRRRDRGSFSPLLSDTARLQMLVPNSTTRASPLVRRHVDRIATVWRASLPWSEKRSALGYVLRAAYWDRTDIMRSLKTRLLPRRSRGSD